MPLDARWSVVVHGGARSIPEADRAINKQGCFEAVSAAASILASGGSALDAAETAVKLLEDLPQFNAGRGAVHNDRGEIELDAAIMDGATLALGGVGALRDFRNPVAVARQLLDRTPTLLVADGASRFAREIGAATALVPVPSAVSGGGDTVGCIVRDLHGNLAAANSTGGLERKMAGRIGDTPIPGCGLYADNMMGAAALSGDGEVICRNMLAARALFALHNAGPEAAAKASIQQLRRTGGEAGIIMLDADGRLGIAHNSEHFAVAVGASWMSECRAATRASDLEEWFS